MAKKRKRQPSVPPDDGLVPAAVRKRQAEPRITHEERQALRRLEKEREEDLRWIHYRSIPKRHYCELSGRAHQSLINQAARYGIPLRGRTVDLGAVLTAFHDLLRDHGKAILSGSSNQHPDAARDALALWREERARIAKIERCKLEGSLVSMEEMSESVTMLAGILRRANEQLMREYGAAAGDIMDEALDDYALVVKRRFGGGET